MTTDHQMSWDSFLTALDIGSEQVAVSMLDAMIAAARSPGPAGAGELLRLSTTIEPAEDGQWPTVCWHVSGPVDGDGIEFRLPLECLRAHEDELRACADGELRALEIVSFALASACRGHGEARWHPHDVGRAIRPTVADLEQRLRGYRSLSRDERVEPLLQDGRDVLVYGHVGTGKTTTAAHQAMQYVTDVSSVLWLDLTDPLDCDESVAWSLLRLGPLEHLLLVIDDVQANVSAARGVFDLVVRLRRDLAIPIVVLATGSPVIYEVEPPLCSTHLEPVLADGHALVHSILDGEESLRHHPVAKAQISTLAGGDAFVAGMALSLWREHGHIAGTGEFADFVIEQFKADSLSPEAQRLLYYFACLSACEIQVGKQRITLLPPERTALPELIAARLIEVNDEAYSIRHRSLARLLVLHGRRSWNGDAPLPSPVVFAYDYLQRAGSAQIRAMLDKLDLLPFDREPSRAFDRAPPQAFDRAAQTSSASLASAWKALGLLGDSLAHRVRQGPDWDDEVASAAFAGMALAKLGARDAWKMTADFIRGRWSYDQDDQLPCWVGEPSADLKTFEALRELAVRQFESGLAMDVQDASGPPQIDAERSCRTWMLGVLLCFEALAPERDWSRIDRLRAIATHVSDGGAFYPSEAPWVTAQVIQGLCLAGSSYEADPTVRRACDWLCQDKRLGGAYQTGWQNAVSVSTFDVMTTALCLLALWQARCRNDQLLQIAYQKLRDEQEVLISSPHHETELALIVAARLRHKDRWEDLSPPILQLLGWVTRERWRSPDIKASQPGDPVSATAKLPFIASQLWVIIWAAAKQELPSLLAEVLHIEDVAPPEGPWPVTDPARSAVLRGPAGPVPERAGRTSEEDRKSARLRQRIDDRLNGLADASRSLDRQYSQETVRKDIEYWHDLRDRLNSIEAELDSGTATQSTIDRLDALGHEVFGETW